MCCLFTVLVFLGPRAGILIWWLLEPVRWAVAFNSVLWPILGFFVLPWTTLVYVAVSPGGVTGFDLLWIALTALVDTGMWFGGGYGNRDRVRVW